MGKVVTLWSPVSCTGTTTASILLANKLGKEYSVCLIDLDLNNADISLYLNITDAEHNIDNLIPYIQGRNLTEEIFYMNLIDVKNFRFMQGTHQVDKGPFFQVEHIEPIVDMAEKLFDIVIINTNSAIDNAGTFIALKRASVVVMVMNQNIIHFKKYIDKAQLLDDLITHPIVLVNKYSKNILLTLDNIKENLNTEVYPLARLDEVIVLNDINTQNSIFDTFSNKKAKTFDKNLTEFSERLLVLLDLKKEANETKKKKKFFVK